jgi:hypothetical protein
MLLSTALHIYPPTHLVACPELDAQAVSVLVAERICSHPATSDHVPRLYRLHEAKQTGAGDRGKADRCKADRCKCRV